MAHDLGVDLDQLLAECRQGPVLDRLRQSQGPQEVAEIVGQSMQLEANLVAPKAMARERRPVTRKRLGCSYGYQRLACFQQ